MNSCVHIMMRSFQRFIVLSAFMAVLLSGCAEKGPILLSVGYPIPEGQPAVAAKAVVGVSPFKDERGKRESLIGMRTIPSGMQNDLVVEGTVSGLVTAALKNALKARGFAVKDVPAWDLTAQGMKSGRTGLMLGGVIKKLWLDSKAPNLNTHVAASVQLKITAGDPAGGKIIKTLDVESSVEQDVLYSDSKLEEILSEAIGGAIDQIFNDDDLKKKLQ